MYDWIWRHLPGGTPLKIPLAVALAVTVVLLLFEVVFPWAEPRLPFGDVIVDSLPSQPAPPS